MPRPITDTQRRERILALAKESNDTQAIKEFEKIKTKIPEDFTLFHQHSSSIYYTFMMQKQQLAYFQQLTVKKILEKNSPAIPMDSWYRACAVNLLRLGRLEENEKTALEYFEKSCTTLAQITPPNRTRDDWMDLVEIQYQLGKSYQHSNSFKESYLHLNAALNLILCYSKEEMKLEDGLLISKIYGKLKTLYAENKIHYQLFDFAEKTFCSLDEWDSFNRKFKLLCFQIQQSSDLNLLTSLKQLLQLMLGAYRWEGTLEEGPENWLKKEKNLTYVKELLSELDKLQSLNNLTTQGHSFALGVALKISNLEQKIEALAAENATLKRKFEENVQPSVYQGTAVLFNSSASSKKPREAITAVAPSVRSPS